MRMQKLLFVFCFMAVATGVATAQYNKVVTNADLEKYRAERLRAEQELKNDYAKLGFSSPEERAKRDAESQRLLIEMSDRIRSQRLEGERIDAERQAAETMAWAVYNGLATQQSQAQPQSQSYYSEGYVIGGFGGYGGYGGYGPYRQPRYQYYRQDGGYVSGGSYWPSGPRMLPQPVIPVPNKP
jgi:hypothetical protein